MSEEPGVGPDLPEAEPSQDDGSWEPDPAVVAWAQELEARRTRERGRSLIGFGSRGLLDLLLEALLGGR